MNDGGIVNGWLTRIRQVATKALSGADVADEMRQVVSEAVEQISGWKSGSTPEENLNALYCEFKRFLTFRLGNMIDVRFKFHLTG